MSEREKAIQYVTRLVERYRTYRGYGFLGARRHAEELAQELGMMQARGEPGETLARRWCHVVGL